MYRGTRTPSGGWCAPDRVHDKSVLTLLFRLLPFFVCSSSGLGLLFNKQGRVLLTKAKGAAPRQKLGVRRWFTTGITSPNMGFHSFHSYTLPPKRLVLQLVLENLAFCSIF